MLKCLMKYEWVKLRRDPLPAGKGIKSDARKPIGAILYSRKKRLLAD